MPPLQQAMNFVAATPSTPASPTPAAVNTPPTLLLRLVGLLMERVVITGLMIPSTSALGPIALIDPGRITALTGARFVVGVICVWG
ncbi:MAG: hypothetical protein AAGJ80_20180 [Cyanobacteria bacterium J06553_1]